MHRDLTAGSVTKNLLSMSLPTMFGFMSQTLYDLVDMAWIGRISPEAVASVTIFTTIFWLAEVMNEIIGTGSVSLISQSYGSGDTERTRRVIEQTIAFKALVALISATFLLLFLKPLIAFFTDDPLVRRSALEYGYIRIFFLPIMFHVHGEHRTAVHRRREKAHDHHAHRVGSQRRSRPSPHVRYDPGNPHPWLRAGGLRGGAGNHHLDHGRLPGGILHPLLQMARVRITLRGIFRLEWAIDRKLFAIGAPSGLEMLSRNGAQFLTLKFISTFGTVAVAAIGIGMRLMGSPSCP
jgi:Na+-driven multidrug efflux pump